MPNTSLSKSVWGCTSSPKRALLIHGLTCNSHSWHRVAHGLAAQGYFVVAPDLPGHGASSRSPRYTFASIVKEVEQYFASIGHIDLIIGHSFGALVALALLQSIRSAHRPTRVVLLDPPLEFSSFRYSQYLQIFRDATGQTTSPEDYREAFPTWTREDAAYKSMADATCDPAVVNSLFEENNPWSFSHLLRHVPSRTKITVLAADPSYGALFRAEEALSHPFVRTLVLPRCTHWIPQENPRAILQAAMELES